MHRVLEEILEENKWRNGEFAKFKINSSNVDASLWFRMCIPMIYAHWEGFVVSAIKVLVTHLNSLSLRPQETKTALTVHGLGTAYQSLAGKQRFDQKVAFTDKFKAIFNEPIKFPSRINTKSNLKKDVFQEICEVFEFDFRKFELCLRDIDTLVNIRNSIAHGENSVMPDINNIEKYINAVNMAIDLLTGEIEIFLSNESYKVIC